MNIDRPDLQQLLDSVRMERARQDKKWGRDFPKRTHSQWLAIVVEEIGEASKEINQRDEVNTQEARQEHDYKMRKEVIEAAAVCLSWLELGPQP